MKAIVGDDVVAFPPKIEWLQAWAMMFRCSGTFSNYLGYAKVGCILVKEDTSVFQHAAVKRAKDSVRKAGRFAAREKMWIRGHRIEAILIWAEVGVCIAACMVRCVCMLMLVEGQPGSAEICGSILAVLCVSVENAVGGATNGGGQIPSFVPWICEAKDKCATDGGGRWDGTGGRAVSVMV